MAQITGYTAARMQAIEDQAIISGAIVGSDLILTRYNAATINAGVVIDPNTVVGAAIVGDDLVFTQRDATTFNAGMVRGDQGIQGPVGPPGPSVYRQAFLLMGV